MADLVTIACKHPNGLVLEVYEDAKLDGVKAPTSVKKIVVHGSRKPLSDAGLPTGDWEIIGGYGLTPGVPKDFWDRFVSQHKGFEPLSTGALRATPMQDAQSEAKAVGPAVQSGLEPINPAEVEKKYGIEEADTAPNKGFAVKAAAASEGK